MRRTMPLSTLVLLVLASPALAQEGGGGRQAVVTAFWTVVFLLLCLPLAVLFRASLSYPLRVANTLRERPWTTLLLGAVNILLLAVIASAGQIPIIGIVVVLIGIAAILACLLGLLAVATELGRRLFDDEGRGNSVGAFVLAWLVISGLALVPIAGHLALLWLTAQGLGAVILTFYRRNTPPPESAGK